MSRFLVIRLGKDSVPDIRRIDAEHASPTQPVNLQIPCRQVSDQVAPGNFAFLWLGSDNSKGAPTDWKQGLRAFGVVTKKTGGPSWKDEWTVSLSVPIVFPTSITHHQFLAKAPTAYYWFSGVPVLGVSTYSNQTVQQIKEEEVRSNVKALFYAVRQLYPAFHDEVKRRFPELSDMFNYVPPNPAALDSFEKEGPLFEGRSTMHETKALLSEMTDAFFSAVSAAGIRVSKETIGRFLAALLTKPFVILTGLSGSGKSKLAHAFASWITPPALPPDPFIPGMRIQGAQSEYTIERVNSGIIELSSSEGKVVALPRAILDEWAQYIDENQVPESVNARELRDQIEAKSKYTSYLHRLESHYKPLAYALLEARKTAAVPKCFALIPVGADWTGKEHIIGYSDGLRAPHNGKPGFYVTTPVLDLVRQALTPAHSKIPHVLILDEMNLSHVERYFADFLSAIESREAFPLHDGSKRIDDNGREVEALMRFPENLFVIGTVNVDETTYMFSPKVLDRANVIEFTVSHDDLVEFMDNPAPIDLALLAGAGTKYSSVFLEEALRRDLPLDELGTEVKRALQDTLSRLFVALVQVGAEFGYRAAYEISRFVCYYARLAGTDWQLDAALDAAVMQKILPKLNGSKTKLSPVLTELKKVITQDRFPISFAKIGRMEQRLRQNGFTSYTEA
jgi:hypothetical protein